MTQTIYEMDLSWSSEPDYGVRDLTSAKCEKRVQVLTTFLAPPNFKKVVL